jgi:hypothetical protein
MLTKTLLPRKIATHKKINNFHTSLLQRSMDWRDTSGRDGTEIQKKYQTSLEDIKYSLQNNKDLLQKIIIQNEEKNNLLIEMSSQSKQNNELLHTILKQNTLHFLNQQTTFLGVPTNAEHLTALGLLYDDLKKKYDI